MTKENENNDKPLIGIVMGSKSDLPVMEKAANLLKDFEVPYELTVVSAHRTPDRLREYATTAESRGIKVIIAGAGGAAHLPGMIAAYSILPIIGVPVKSSNSIDGWDSILSILQMPPGVPVATVALNAADNAGIIALQIIGTANEVMASRLHEYKKMLIGKVDEMVMGVKEDHPNHFD